MNLFLLLAIAYDAVRIFREETRGGEGPVRFENPGVVPQKGSVAVPVTGGQEDWQPFGRPGVAQSRETSKESVPNEVPDTRLQLTLLGVLASGGSDRAWALVRSGNEGDRMFAVGDKVPGDARIVSVRPDRIILEKGGRFEALRLPKTTVSLEPRPVVPVAPAANEAAAVLRQLREQFLVRPYDVTSKITVTPVERNGVFGGYALQPGSEPGLLEKLGLSPGDVVTVVNGVSLTSPMKGMEALGALGKSQSLQLHLLRDGKAVTVGHTLTP
ncbi:MAG: type II secretion system protein GspC [Magnetococcales bacterium]|nr:type II secretion system protein GspC [Magnetococcales bacterium]